MNEIVYGIQKFKEYFKDFSDKYIIVGGTATALYLKEQSLDARITKDIDMILISDNLDSNYGEIFWKFINDGGYEKYCSKDNVPHYYRFINKSNNGFPKMIEIFSKKQAFAKKESIFTPIKIDEDISSLSAIVLDDNYYSFLLEGKEIKDDISVLSPYYLIAFKAKAHLDLTKKKKDNPKSVNEADSKKHKNDIIRLLQLFTGEEKYETPKMVKCDIEEFVSLIENDYIAYDILTNGALTKETAISLIKKVYGL